MRVEFDRSRQAIWPSTGESIQESVEKGGLPSRSEGAQSVPICMNQFLSKGGRDDCGCSDLLEESWSLPQALNGLPHDWRDLQLRVPRVLPELELTPPVDLLVPILHLLRGNSHDVTSANL